MTATSPEQNKALVLEAFETLFNKRDYVAAERFIGANLKGKILGVLNLGNIGGAVAEIGKAFGMGVIAWSQRQ
jgi:phosphoglycerate dehydrogenase-like enzyme